MNRPTQPWRIAATVDEETKHHRRSIRLGKHNYSTAGGYFITLCTHNRECLLGEIRDGKMVSSRSGQIVRVFWDVLPGRFPHSSTDSFVIMPNHIHGIIMIDAGVIHESALLNVPTKFSRRNMLLSKMVGFLKMNSSKKINSLRGTPGAFVWQRNYYEHVIRNDIDLEETREYIENNPLKWLEDRENPENI